MEKIRQHIEALIFASENPVTIEEILQVLNDFFEVEFEESTIVKHLNSLTEQYNDEIFAFELVNVAGGYQFLTKGAFHGTIAMLLRLSIKRRLSKAAIETLSIIAYKQPVSKTVAEKIRGVSCDYSIGKLLDKELIEILGRSDGPGRPLLYGTTGKFLEYLGINDISELPKLKEFEEPKNEIGEKAPIEEGAEEQTNTN